MQAVATGTSQRRALRAMVLSVCGDSSDIASAYTDQPFEFQSIAELCQLLNCSRRQIELAFNDVYGLGPIADHRNYA